MTAKKTKKAPRATPRVGMKPVPRGTKKAPADDGLSRAEIEKANAAGPGAVADLIRGGARKTAKATPPAKGKGAKPTTTTATPTKAATPARDRDPRLPRPGGVLTRTFQGKEIKVEVLDAGFKYDGDTWRSLSAIARKVSGTSWNGYLFFNLLKRAAKPAATPTETK
jgi:hypothetical protein